MTKKQFAYKWKAARIKGIKAMWKMWKEASEEPKK